MKTTPEIIELLEARMKELEPDLYCKDYNVRVQASISHKELRNILEEIKG